MQALRVGLAGLGTVGGSVVRLLAENAAAVESRAGRPIELVKVANRSRKPELPLAGAAFDHDLASLATSEVDVVLELIGGDTEARALAERTLDAGQHFITANKALLAACGDYLFAKAQGRGLALGFEGAVAGGIPIINALRSGLAANTVDLLAGIVNGTTNYILTAMAEGGAAFADALADAQRLGYAEADPTFDVEGIDAAQKIAVLAALAFDTDVDFHSVHVEGISGVDLEDIRYASELGYVIKHLGVAALHDGGVLARIHPALVPESQLLAKVAGAMNAVLANGDAVGQTLYVGAGAGGMATASAVVADLIALARGELRVPQPGQRELRRLGIGELRCAHYLKIPAMDQPGVFAEVAEALSRHAISIEAVIQRPPANPASEAAWVHIVILTNEVAEHAVETAVRELGLLAGVAGAISRLRVVDFAALAGGNG